MGLISINERYAVPTCPSKLVSYFALKVPVLALINPGNDVGALIETAGAGFWAVGSDWERVVTLFDRLYEDPALRKSMGEKGQQFYREHLTARKAYQILMQQIGAEPATSSAS